MLSKKYTEDNPVMCFFKAKLLLSEDKVNEKIVEEYLKKVITGDYKYIKDVYVLIDEIKVPNLARNIFLFIKNLPNVSSESYAYLGRAYRDGKGVTKDLSVAAEWMRKAKDNGLLWASWELFDILWKIDTPDSNKEMIVLAKPLAESGVKEMQGRLGLSYKEGRGNDKNLLQAEYWLRKACVNNYRWTISLSDVLWELGTSESYKEYFDVLMPYALNGESGAMGRVGRAYRDGKGVTKDLSVAAEWMEKASQTESKWINPLIDVLWRIGTDDSLSKMIDLLNIQVSLKNYEAMARLGRAYLEGKGVEKDINVAKLWLRQAAENNNSQAQTLLENI